MFAVVVAVVVAFAGFAVFAFFASIMLNILLIKFNSLCATATRAGTLAFNEVDKAVKDGFNTR